MPHSAEAPHETYPASWANLPHKDQLAVLALCRVVDFFQFASFQTICYYQLKAFSPSVTEQTLSWQTGVAMASFNATQSCTAILWGYLADTKWIGRKNVLLFGLIGTSLSCVGVAFSGSLFHVVLFRALGGLLNGTVGIVRTMMSEAIGHRKHQARAFLLLPASFSVAAILGPVSAGWLSDLTMAYPDTFSHVLWVKHHPYSLPSLLSAVLLMFMSIAVFFFLNETLDGFIRNTPLAKPVKEIFSKITTFNAKPHSPGYSLLSEEARPAEIKESFETASSEGAQERKPRLPFRRIWTSNVVLTMVAVAIFEFHLGAFGSTWPLLLSSPKKVNSTANESFPATGGGLGIGPRNLGYATAFMGVTGLSLQFLLYPRVHRKLGTLKCFRVFSLLFPVSYVLTPLLVVISGSSVDSTAAIVWISIFFILAIHMAGRIFCIPATITLLNNCAPHPSVLGLVHGIGQSTSAAFRMLGPICAGYLYGIGYENDVTQLSWWAMSVFGFVAWLASQYLREGSGHEIKLPGESEKDDE